MGENANEETVAGDGDFVQAITVTGLNGPDVFGTVEFFEC
jgi:hypothetical protein